jgi:hypothetical protein
MEMHVQPESRIKPLHKRHRTGVRTWLAETGGGAFVVAGNRAHQNATHRGKCRRIMRADKPHPIRQRQHPLPHRRLIRDHLVHQERCGIDHASSAARRTEPAALARKGDHFVLPTVLAEDPGKAVRQDAATQEPFDLAPAEPRDVTFSMG